MSLNPDHVLAPLARKLSLREELTPADRDAILALPFSRRKLESNQYLVWDGDRPQNTCLCFRDMPIVINLPGMAVGKSSRFT
jgi:hypothetical protein